MDVRAGTVDGGDEAKSRWMDMPDVDEVFLRKKTVGGRDSGASEENC